MQTFKPGDSFYYFEIVRILGAGAHGAVYEIRHRQTGDLFALKTMHAADSVDPNKTARALVAAKGNYRIDHQNVVKVLDLNCEASGLVWMRTELLRGYTLQELLARQGRLSLPFALAVAIEAAAGLAALHEAQIIHRDVKPSNLFYTDGRAVKVLDLSLAKVFPEGLETTAGGRRLGLGTPAYSAPEQLEGVVRPDVRFDVYGLGITLWEMLAGRNPNADVLDNAQELIKRQLTVMPRLLSEVAGLPPRVDEVVRKAIAKDPAHRYSSMMEMSRALMDLSAWVTAEAQAGRQIIHTPHGEPALPCDSNTWRDYRPPEMTPEHYAPPSGPRDRVILADPTPPVRPTQGAKKLAATVPMPPPGGLAGTLPLDEAYGPSAPMGVPRAPTTSAANLLILPPAPSPSPLASRPAAGPAGSAPHGSPGAVTKTPPRLAGGQPPRQASWYAVLAALIAACIAGAALAVWLLRRPPTSGAPAPEMPEVIASSALDMPAPLPAATLQVEPTPGPPAAPAMAAGSVAESASARPSASPPVRRRTPSTPLPAPPPLSPPPTRPRQRFGIEE